MTGRTVKRRARIGVTLLAALCTARLGIAQEPPAGQTPPPAAPVVAPSSPAPVPAQAPQSPAAPPSSDAHDQRTSRISDDSVPTLDVEHYPARPRPIVELGPHFLGNGNIARSFRLPTGAVWLPQLIVFGTYSTALQGVRSPVSGKWTSEWSNRLDLFTNLQLSGTERLLVGFRPLDNRDGASGYNFTPGVLDRGDHHLNAELHSLFFEGDFGEIFPLLDRTDRRRLDIGFSIGRQQFAFEDGILINDDAVDAVGVTRNTVLPRGGSNLQLTGLFGWGSIEGSNGLRRERSQLFGLLTTADIGQSSFNGELFVVRDRAGANDGLYWALSRVRRIGALNTTFRALGSYALHDEALPGVVDTGHLLFSEVSFTPPWSTDLAYFNAFWSIGDFTSVSRAPGTGGPLGRAGILFASPGFGRYPAPLSNRADDAVGGALGYQKFFDDSGRRQVIVELGGRRSRARTQETSAGAGVRFQQAFGRHTVLQFDVFGKSIRRSGPSAGLRLETRLEF